MSGFVGIVNPDEMPVDRDLLWQLTRSVAYRGPAAEDVWIQGRVGFGHTMLRSTVEADTEKQPCTLDGDAWITADCRIDDRARLVGELVSGGRSCTVATSDPELILHAWAVWGADCVQHLLGDFAFAIWDRRTSSLFCARDHMGIKPFYYSPAGACLVFGNTLNSLRLHPSVSDRLNDLAIGDFLLFGLNQDPGTTSFRDISRLPAAHTLAWQDGRLDICRYWTMPIDPPLRMPKRNDYVEYFLELLRTAIRDRLRVSSVGIFMSGGLDSTGLAAVSKELAGVPPMLDVSAHTVVYDRIVPDEERYYAGLVARHLGMSISFYPIDDDDFYPHDGGFQPPPADPAFISETGPQTYSRELRGIGQKSCVAFYGEGPDNALTYEWKTYVARELERGRLGSIMLEFASFPFLFGDLPFSKRLGRKKHADKELSAGMSFPSWLNRDFERRFHLRERFAAGGIPMQSEVHPYRPVGYASFQNQLWSLLFERLDPGVTGIPVEVRHPYLDIRVLRFLLALPVLPWCRDKYLLRHALRNRLPAVVVARPKSPGLPVLELERRFPERVASEVFAQESILCEYVSHSALQVIAKDPLDLYFVNLRPLTLGFFLRSSSRPCIM